MVPRLLTIILSLLTLHVDGIGVNYSLNSATDGFDKHRRRIVIDAGHGGHDSGACGSAHKEKDLSLQMALRLGNSIEKYHPEIEVIYTRTTDVFIPLYERIGKANKVKADLFISIHCNYISNSRTKGTETFVMGLHRAGENLDVAKRENEVILLENDYESNYDGYDPNSPIGTIILSTFQDVFLEQSISVAAQIERNFKAQGMSTSRGVKQAGFAVLRKATMPSILVETGFISNKEEEKWLASEEGQEAVATNIRKAISNYFNSLEQVKETKAPMKEEVVLNTKEGENNPDIISDTRIDIVPTKPLKKHFVQFAAMKQEVTNFEKDDLEKVGPINIVRENSYIKYQIGPFSSPAEANEAKQKLQNLGYKSSFLVSSM